MQRFRELGLRGLPGCIVYGDIARRSPPLGDFGMIGLTHPGLANNVHVGQAAKFIGILDAEQMNVGYLFSIWCSIVHLPQFPASFFVWPT